MPYFIFRLHVYHHHSIYQNKINKDLQNVPINSMIYNPIIPILF